MWLPVSVKSLQEFIGIQFMKIIIARETVFSNIDTTTTQEEDDDGK